MFAHDNKFFEFDGSYYSSGGFNSTVWDRYLGVFDKLTVVSRQEKVLNLQKKMDLSDHKDTEFICVPELNTLSYVKNIRKAKNIIREQVKRSDYIIARLPSTIGTLAVDIAISEHKPYLIEVVGCVWDSYWNHSFKGKALAPSSFLKMRKQVKEANYVIYVTSSFLQYRYPTRGKNTNVSNVLLDNQDDNILDTRIKKINSMQNDSRITIGTTAAIDVRYKGQEYIIRALANLKEKGITNFDYELVGAGEGLYLKKLAKKLNVENEVKFVGTLPHKDVFEWLKNIDIYAQPSKQEGLPRALIEAMSMGIPAFGAKTAGIPELINSKYIFKHELKSTDKISKILMSYNKNAMLDQAIENFKESEKYNVKILGKRRYEFLTDFKNNY